MGYFHGVFVALLCTAASALARLTPRQQADQHWKEENLVNSARVGDLGNIETALEMGADINCRPDASGQTPLMAAALSGQAEAVEVLLQKGADVSVGEKDGYTA